MLDHFRWSFHRLHWATSAALYLIWINGHPSSSSRAIHLVFSARAASCRIQPFAFVILSSISCLLFSIGRIGVSPRIICVYGIVSLIECYLILLALSALEEPGFRLESFWWILSISGIPFRVVRPFFIRFPYYFRQV